MYSFEALISHFGVIYFYKIELLSEYKIILLQCNSPFLNSHKLKNNKWSSLIVFFFPFLKDYFSRHWSSVWDSQVTEPWKAAGTLRPCSLPGLRPSNVLSAEGLCLPSCRSPYTAPKLAQIVHQQLELPVPISWEI